MVGIVACERPLHEEIDGETEAAEPAVLVPGDDGYVDPARRSLPLVMDATLPDAYPGPVVDAQVAVGEAVEAQPAAPEQAEPVIYEVQSGDTLVNIALQYDVSVDDIATASGLENVDVLDIGQRLVIPVDGLIPAETAAETAAETPAEAPVVETDAEGPATEEPVVEQPPDQIHVVQSGDNLFRIGLLYGCKHEELATYNSLANPDTLDVGQEIRIPTCE